MVGRPFGAAIITGDMNARDTIGQHWRAPDVVEASAFVGGRPVRRTIAPPRVELRRLRRVLAHAVDPAARRSRGCYLLALDRRMRHDPPHLLVTPDIVLERRHIEIAD